MAPMKAAKGLALGILSAGCVVMTGCGGKGKGDENSLQGKTFGKFIILDEVQTDGGDRSLAKKNAENTLVKYPEVEAMVGLWAYNAPQCIEALKDAGKLGEVKIFSFDEDPVTLDAIKDGHCEGTMVQDPYLFGYSSMRGRISRSQSARS